MKSQDHSDRGGRISFRLIFAGAICLGIPFLLVAATGPNWWYNSSITPGGTAPVVSGTANDYAAVTQGQVKNFAVTGVNELNTVLAAAGGAGNTLNNLAASLSATSGSTSDFTPINLGAMKNIAKPFYDRLAAIDYAGPPLLPGNAPWVTGTGIYPWTSGTANDFAMANIGQTKNIFSFDLTYSSDGNSLPNWWRMYFFGTLSVSGTNIVSIRGSNVTYLQAYQQNLNPLPAPVLSVPAGPLNSATSVTLSAPGSTSIYYTTNGTDPLVDGILYTGGPIPIQGITLLKAVAYHGSVYTEEVTAMYSIIGSPAMLSAGQYHTLSVRSDGSVWAWGQNQDGQLGINSDIDQWFPTPVSLPSVAVGVSAGGYHSLAVTIDGRVWAWGLQFYDEIGLSPPPPYTSSTASVVVGATNAIAVAAGYSHSVALTSSGTVLTWGDNSDGELGIGSSEYYQSSPAAVTISDTSGVVAIAAGSYFTVALTNDGNVWAWGNNGNGECGTTPGSTPTYSSPVEITSTNISSIMAVSAGDEHILALRADGTVWAWGDNNFNELGGGPTVSSYSYTPVEVLTSSGTLTGVTAIAAGYGYSIAVKSDGTVWGWGSLGSVSFSGTYYATQVTGVSGAAGVTASLYALITATNGAITAMGVNSNGQLGVGMTSGTLTSVASLATAIAQPSPPTFAPDGGIYTGSRNVVITCTNSGATIYYTTDGSTPGPGNGTEISSGQSVSISNPTILRAMDIVASVSSLPKSAAYHMGYQLLGGGGGYGDCSMLLDTDGSVWTWGSNSGVGQLGLDWATGNQVLPQLVTGLSGTAAAISVGYYTSAAVVSSGSNHGTVWEWGGNQYGQCGSSNPNPTTTPVQIPDISGAIAVSCGVVHTVALTGSGTVLTWGNNWDGELGDGGANPDFTDTPVQVAGITNAKAIAAGGDDTIVLLNDGTVWAWGGNYYGELGSSNVAVGDISYDPVQVTGLNGIVAIATAGDSNLALRNDGTVWAWGFDGPWLLADDTYQSEPIPVLVGTMRDIAGISVGLNNGVALNGNGSIIQWGNLGGPTPSLPVPVASVALTQGTTSLPSIPTMVSAGDVHALEVVNTDGVQTLWGWGDNSYGELGDGTTVSSDVPVMVQWSGYADSGNAGIPDWVALTLDVNPDAPGTNAQGIPDGILYEDGLGLNPTLPYTPYTPPSGSGGSPPVIYVTIPAGATLE